MGPAEQAVLSGAGSEGATPWGNSCEYLVTEANTSANAEFSHPFYFRGKPSSAQSPVDYA
jgi:hypothetical protein